LAGPVELQGAPHGDQLVLALITLTVPPAVPMFVLAQRYIVPGLTAGAVKG
jgi:ABC-type glycerol-3-phosphate transport system permease component